MAHFNVKVSPVSFHFYYVLVWACGFEEVGVRFYPFGLVDDGNGGTV